MRESASNIKPGKVSDGDELAESAARNNGPLQKGMHTPELGELDTSDDPTLLRRGVSFDPDSREPPALNEPEFDPDVDVTFFARDLEDIPTPKEIRTDAPAGHAPAVIAAPAPTQRGNVGTPPVQREIADDASPPRMRNSAGNGGVDIPEFPPNVVVTPERAGVQHVRERPVPPASHDLPAVVGDQFPASQPKRRRGGGAAFGALVVAAVAVLATIGFLVWQTAPQAALPDGDTPASTALLEPAQAAASTPMPPKMSSAAIAEAGEDTGDDIQALEAEWSQQLEADSSAFAAMDLLLARLDDAETAAGFAPYVDDAVEKISGHVDSPVERALAYESLRQVYPEHPALQRAHHSAVADAVESHVEAGRVDHALQWYRQLRVEAGADTSGELGPETTKALLARAEETGDAALASELRQQHDVLGVAETEVARAPSESSAPATAQSTDEADTAAALPVPEVDAVEPPSRNPAQSTAPAAPEVERAADSPSVASAPHGENAVIAPESTQFGDVPPTAEPRRQVARTREQAPPLRREPFTAIEPQETPPTRATTPLFEAMEPTSIRIRTPEESQAARLSAPAETVSRPDPAANPARALLDVRGPQQGAQSITATLRDAAGRPLANELVKVAMSVGVTSHYTKLLTTDAQGVATLDVTPYINEARRLPQREDFRYTVTTPNVSTNGAYVSTKISALP